MNKDYAARLSCHGSPTRPELHHIDSAYLWCEQNLPDGSWWYVGNGRFEFDDDKNRLWFILTQT